MGLKKYEIITVGSDKRVRALRSWQVGDRYVNIGDVGGIVYDEKTLSQDGACWLFRGNFGFPGARIGGDSIVDVGEATLSATGAPNVDILGSSVVVGSKLQFASDQTAADAVQLTGSHFEQGGFGYSNPLGTNWEGWKVVSPNYIRTAKPIFAGGVPTTLKLDVPGYRLNWFALDRDSNVIATGADITSGEGITTVVPACQSFAFRLAKDPIAAIVPADATAAQITFTGTYETKLSIVDSRVEINPATSTGVITIKPGGTHTVASGVKYPDSVIQNSKVIINATSNRGVRFMSDLSNVNATLDATTADAQSVGTYRSVNNIVFTGTITGYWDSRARSLIQAYNCDNMVVSTTIFPGLAAARTANAPFIFQGCNVPNGIFYHHAQIANTYKNIDFAKAQADLGKSIPSTSYPLVSSEVEGMYRYCNTFAGVYGFMVESFDSVKSLGAIPFVAATYGTTIYKDAYLSGKFDLGGTLVLGGTRKHDQVQPIRIEGRAMQGLINTTTVGEKVTGVSGANDRVSVMVPIRVGGANAISVQAPDTIESFAVFVDAKNVITVTPGWSAGNRTIEGASSSLVRSADKVYFVFRRKGGGLFKPEDLKDVSVVEYHGCKIINTDNAKAIILKGNIRVEDDAHLINASVEGSGYFGGRSTISNANIIGSAYMDDNAVYANGEVAEITDLVMRDNAHYEGTPLESIISLTMYDNSKCYGTVDLLNGSLFMKDNAEISADAIVDAVGTLVMKDNAIVDSTLNTSGRIVLQGDYNQATQKTWKGCRNIDSVNAPEYDNNVKTQYDF